MKNIRIGRFGAEPSIPDRRKSTRAASAVLALTILALPAHAAPAGGAARPSATQYYNCEYADAATHPGLPLRTTFRFDPRKPYSFMEAFAAGHSIHTTVVTADQVVDQVILYANPRQPERASGIAFVVLNRRTLAYRQHTERIDPQTYEPVADSDRNGVCVLGRDPYAR